MLDRIIDRITGESHVARRDPHRRHCHACARIFAADTVPAPDPRGLLICRDCRTTPAGTPDMAEPPARP